MSSSYAAFIYEDLILRIRKGENIALSQRKLAAWYGCSTRPIGRAIDQLVGQKYLSRLSNGRSEINDQLPKPKIANTRIEVRSPLQLRHEIESSLILESLRGQPRYLREEKLAEHFGLGRTALRSILTSIATSSLLSHEKNKGWKLRVFTEKDLNDFLSIRELMELAALDAAKTKLEKKVLEYYLDQNLEPESASQVSDNNEFHEYILQKANNQYISGFFENHAPFFRQLFSWEEQDPGMQKQARQQHRSILNHLIDKNWDAAKKDLSHHIWNNHDLLVESVRVRRSEESKFNSLLLATG